MFRLGHKICTLIAAKQLFLQKKTHSTMTHDRNGKIVSFTILHKLFFLNKMFFRRHSKTKTVLKVKDEFHTSLVLVFDIISIEQRIIMSTILKVCNIIKGH